MLHNHSELICAQPLSLCFEATLQRFGDVAAAARDAMMTLVSGGIYYPRRSPLSLQGG
jgi:3-deoxy-D-arabino-heptulosonate 7-phosphate (DAHP) synthase